MVGLPARMRPFKRSRTFHTWPEDYRKRDQTTYSQRILLSFLHRGITNLTIGSKRSSYPISGVSL